MKDESPTTLAAVPRPRPENYWRPRTVRLALHNYRQLALCVAVRDPRQAEYSAHEFGYASWEAVVDTFTDIRAALLWLEVDDPRAANVLWSLYVDKHLADFSLSLRRVRVGDDEGVHWQTILRWEKAGIRALARRLGWVPVTKEEANE